MSSLTQHYTEYTLVPADDDDFGPVEGDELGATLDEGLEYDNYGLQDVLAPVEEEEEEVEGEEGRPMMGEPPLDGFEILMSEEKAAQRAKVCMTCLKSYAVIFVLFILSMVVLMSSGGGGGGGGGEEEIPLNQGFRELRLGGRRIWYTVTDSTVMANHTVLLVHGKLTTSTLFEKLGTSKFLSEHGARVVAVDVLGFGKSDPPLHLLDDYIDFFSEIIALFEMEYNLVLVGVEEGCEMILPYYLKNGVYSHNNSFIEGAVLISPRGDHEKISTFVDGAKAGYPSATRTVIVNGQKDMYVNYDMTNVLEKIPRSEVHALPGQKNSFYKTGTGKGYFHAALQAFLERLEYSYDRELTQLSDQYHQQNQGQGQGQGQGQFIPQQQQQQGQFNQQQGQYNQQQGQYNQGQYQQNNQGQYQQNNLAYGQQQYPQNNFANAQGSQGGFQIPERVNGHINTANRPVNKFKDMSYNPASRFSNLKGKKR